MTSGSRRLKILYVGDIRDRDGSTTTYHRMRAFERLGHEVVAIDTAPAASQRQRRALWHRISTRLYVKGYDGIGAYRFGPRDLAAANAQILEHVRRDSPDIVWIDKGLTIERATLATVKELSPATLIVGYSPDNMGSNRYCQSHHFLEHLTLYDHYFVTKTYSVDELKALGCRAVHYIDPGFEPEVHRPMPVDATTRARFGGPVGFIGVYEGAEGRGRRMEPRGDAVVELARAGVPVRVWGTGWRRRCPSLPTLQLEDRMIEGDDYASAICAFDIVLCFLRHSMRDVVTTRSFEIPACGGFMLAERSEAHAALFREDEEAVFFDTTDEMIDKVRYYLARPEERARIAAAGRARCLRSGYGNTERVASMLKIVAPDWAGEAGAGSQLQMSAPFTCA